MRYSNEEEKMVLDIPVRIRGVFPKRSGGKVEIKPFLIDKLQFP